jgi:hypothetical protein
MQPGLDVHIHIVRAYPAGWLEAHTKVTDDGGPGPDFTAARCRGSGDFESLGPQRLNGLPDEIDDYRVATPRRWIRPSRAG